MKLKNSKYLLLALLVASSVGLSACGQKTEEKAATQTEEKAGETKVAEVKAMKGDELAKIEADKKEKENYLVIDVRSPEEYKAGHLKFAINMPIDTFEADYKKIEAFKDKDVVLYCNSGKKSAKAAEVLVNNGFQKVYNADGVKQFKYELVTFESKMGTDFIQDIKGGKAGLVIDAREAKDFEAGSFDKTVNIMPDDFESKKSSLPTDKNTAIYVFCYSGNKSATVAESLTKEGYTNVVNSLDGTKEIDFGFSK